MDICRLVEEHQEAARHQQNHSPQNRLNDISLHMFPFYINSVATGLFKIASQIEALQRSDHLEQSIAAFRGELAEIRAAITEAMPRRAIDSIGGEIRALSRRIDDNRQSGIDGHVLTNIENALNEIRDVLRSLKSAEQLAGYDEAIRNLGAKLDTILRVNDDPSTVRRLVPRDGDARQGRCRVRVRWSRRRRNGPSRGAC